jgi:hypothetical protein
MSDTKTVDVSRIAFASTVFPTAEDKELWESLTQAEQLAIIERDEEAGFASGVARSASLREILAEVRAEAGK